MGHFDGEHCRRHDFEHCTAKDDSEENAGEDPGRNFVYLKIVRSCVVSYTPLCLEVVKNSFQPFPSDFEGGFRFLHVGGYCLENEDPG